MYNRISVIEPLPEAWELMLRTLFRPFDFTKWLLIGFCAWLAGLLAAGGFSINYSMQGKDVKELGPLLPQHVELSLILMAGAALLLLLLIVLAIGLYWVGSRGSFMFIDCIVHNRGAVKEPWREYAREGNSFFFLYIGLSFIFLLTMLLPVVPLILLFWPHFTSSTPGAAWLGGTDLGLVLLLGALSLLLMIIWGVVFHLLRELVTAVMYRQRLPAVPAARALLRLIRQNPGAFALYVLLSIALGMGAGIVGVTAMCLTCCLAALPYVGTVILLPVILTLRAYGLCFLRQFGPEWDVFGGQAAAAAEPLAGWPMPPPPPPPPPPE